MFCHNSDLASLLVRLLVQVQAQASDSREVVELEVLTPEHRVCSRLAGGARVQHVIQAQLAVVALFRWKIPRLNNPQFKNIVHPTTVILHHLVKMTKT